MFYKRHPVFFLDANAGGGGAPADTDVKANDGKSDDDKKKKEDAPDNGGEDKKQKDLDKQFAERAKRAAEAQKKELYDALGVKDDAEFESLVKAKEDAENERKSEMQKLADQAKKALEALDKLKVEKDAELETMRKRVLDTEIKVLATQAVTDKDGKTVLRAAFRPEALGDILLLIDRSKIEEKEGEISGIDKALAELAKAKPYLLADDQPADKSKGTPRGPAGRQKPKLDDQNDDWFKSL
jgi:hypothetical protein